MTTEWLTAVGLMIAFGVVVWLREKWIQANRQALVAHFISLDRIAGAAGIDRKKVWLVRIHQTGTVKYHVSLGADINGNRRGKLDRVVMLDGSEDYRAIETGIGEQIREALSRP